MGKTNVGKMFGDLKHSIAKHSPEILTGIGIAGMVATTVLAVRATPKALKLIENKQYEFDVDRLTALETVQATWKCYIPAAVTGIVSVSCLIGASSVNLKRNTALATAYKLSEMAITDYKEAVFETIGEKKEQAVRDKVAENRLANNPVSQTDVIITSKGTTLCYDALSGRYFKSDYDAIKKAENKINRQILDEMYASLNDFYCFLDLECTDIGDQVGWKSDNGYVDIDFRSKLTDDGTPCLVIDYSVAPKYDYSKFA